jgi:hypothetical protein
VKNLSKAVQKALAHCGTDIRKERKTNEKTVSTSYEESVATLSTSNGQPYSAHQTERYERYQQVVALREQGIKLREIAKRVGLGVRTVQRWVSQDVYVETEYHHKHRSRFDAYAAYVQQRWDEGCHNIFAAIRSKDRLSHRFPSECCHSRLYCLVSRQKEETKGHEARLILNREAIALLTHIFAIFSL